MYEPQLLLHSIFDDDSHRLHSCMYLIRILQKNRIKRYEELIYWREMYINKHIFLINIEGRCIKIKHIFFDKY
jgi:hypothetical protein